MTLEKRCSIGKYAKIALITIATASIAAGVVDYIKKKIAIPEYDYVTPLCSYRNHTSAKEDRIQAYQLTLERIPDQLQRIVNKSNGKVIPTRIYIEIPNRLPWKVKKQPSQKHPQ